MSKVYNALQKFTMIPEAVFEANLKLARVVHEIPGCIVECGVWRGGMIAGLSTVLGTHRDYVLFDSFDGLPPAQKIDGPAAQAYQVNVQSPAYFDNCRTSSGPAHEAMRVVGATRYDVVRGWFKNTLPDYKFPSPIALLRLDGDWYDSTMTCLTHLFVKVARGGLVVIDDYFAWDGCRQAVHEYFDGTYVLNTSEKDSLSWVVKE